MRFGKKCLVTLTCLALGALVGCATFSNYSDEQKVQICQQSLRVLVEPECVRLAKVDEGQYVALCQEVVGDAVLACKAGVDKDPVLMCGAIATKADQCDLLPDDSETKLQNISTCKRVVAAVSLLCTVTLTKPEVE